jgi:hypothetical protein
MRIRLPLTFRQRAGLLFGVAGAAVLLMAFAARNRPSCFPPIFPCPTPSPRIYGPYEGILWNGLPHFPPPVSASAEFSVQVRFYPPPMPTPTPGSPVISSPKWEGHIRLREVGSDTDLQFAFVGEDPSWYFTQAPKGQEQTDLITSRSSPYSSARGYFSSYSPHTLSISVRDGMALLFIDNVFVGDVEIGSQRSFVPRIVSFVEDNDSPLRYGDLVVTIFDESRSSTGIDRSDPSVVIVSSKMGWQESAITASRGQYIKIETPKLKKSSWRICSDNQQAACNAVGPLGIPSMTDYDDNLVKGCPHGALLVRSGESGDIRCRVQSANYQEEYSYDFIATSDGHLQFRINDLVLSDNSGEITVAVKITNR